MMHCTHIINRASLFALTTISLLFLVGCKPAVEKQVNKGTASSADSTTEPDGDGDSVDSNANSEEFAVEIDGDAVRIRGDLGRVEWDSMVGKEITIMGELVVVDTYDLARRGQVKVARNRLFVPTNHIDPNDADPNGTSFEGGRNVAKVVEAQKLNDQATVILDDDSSEQNIFPPTLFPELGKSYPSVRVGSSIKEVTGKLAKVGNKLVLIADKPLQYAAGTRPERPDVGDANVTVSSFNVLNYFTTIDDGTNRARGADSETELDRQEAKIVAAIIALKADVVGLMEIENNLEAESRLVAALNREIGKEVFKGSGLPDDFRSTPGGQDAIRVGIIYRADQVSPVGQVSTIRDNAFFNARAPIVQSFKAKNMDQPFTVIVNHFKSKGGGDRADENNKNKGDGQGAFNAVRRSQALAITNFIDGLKQVDQQPRVLVIGDLNAYGQEDPIDAMRAKGLVDVQERFGKRGLSGDQGRHYSYVYRGQSGSLDHAMATDALAGDITGIATWHINADEPRFLDYNEEYNPKTLYETGPFRSSDHDPVLIGIRN